MRIILACFLCLFCLEATIVNPVDFEELVNNSGRIVTGTVTNTSTSWGIEHKFIWTRYEISVTETLKGPSERTVTVSEPGGSLDGQVMRVAGSVPYTRGEHVTLFLHQFPSGNLRTVGWAQGKFVTDESGRVHPASPSATSVRSNGGGPARTSLQSLEGIRASDLRSRILAIQKEKAIR